MKPLDGQETIPSEMAVMAEAIARQAQVIDRLLEYNQDLIDRLLARGQDDGDDDQPQRDMAGNLIRTS